MTSWAYPGLGYLLTAAFWLAYLRWSGRGKA